jgi:hypothetical protein
MKLMQNKNIQQLRMKTISFQLLPYGEPSKNYEFIYTV